MRFSSTLFPFIPKINESPAKGSVTPMMLVIEVNLLYQRSLLHKLVQGETDEILMLVKALKISTEKGVALPHKWPENELIGDKVIIPPASTIEEKKAREEAKAKGEIECYDWWFCYKKLE